MPEDLLVAGLTLSDDFPDLSLHYSQLPLYSF